MDMRKNFGVILMMLGVILTINQGMNQNQLIKQIEIVVRNYWPLILSFVGIYIISTPKRKR